MNIDADRVRLRAERAVVAQEIADVNAELTRIPIDRMWMQHLRRTREKAIAKLQRVDGQLSALRDQFSALHVPDKRAAPRSDEELRAANKDLRQRLASAYREIERLRGFPVNAAEVSGDWGGSARDACAGTNA